MFCHIFQDAFNRSLNKFFKSLNHIWLIMLLVFEIVNAWAAIFCGKHAILRFQLWFELMTIIISVFKFYTGSIHCLVPKFTMTRTNNKTGNYSVIPSLYTPTATQLRILSWAIAHLKMGWLLSWAPTYWFNLINWWS